MNSYEFPTDSYEILTVAIVFVAELAGPNTRWPARGCWLPLRSSMHGNSHSLGWLLNSFKEDTTTITIEN